MNRHTGSLAIRKPYLLLVGDQSEPVFAKTAFGLRDWCGEDCVGQIRFADGAVDLGLPDYTPADAARSGAQTVVIGVAVPGGGLSAEWQEVLLALLEAGFDIASGLHDALEDNPALVLRARALGRRLHDVRRFAGPLKVGTGRRRTGRRLLTVGTDCAVGKKYTALAVARWLQDAGHPATFRATGQTGILIAGEGIAVDAVKADFVSGAAEALSPDAALGHWDVVEGQGSLFHPSFAAVTLGLVHGSQPDLMVLCHEAGRTVIAGLPDYRLPDWESAIAGYTDAARLTNPGARVAAISLNCGRLPAEARAAAVAGAEAATGLPVFDPMASAPDSAAVRALVGACAALD
ncbi:DUF1611 domain-containing protein [Wenxinia marina]|uniref:EBNA-1 nuclear protein n=1 Tax=Wenxinia marina DSM 24838 TaxID=1123501 RepID=A0A0D0QB85_9RHOB|nr:DUF1611 domain-containing protein [Wenxinia marina]KIQ68163.1 hypothetical protein Wenmar_03173 [Wenxinia marina DSM 24838]GGL76392.1 hypothetical protein GCM10011392_33570 [Wenxinia marina]